MRASAIKKAKRRFRQASDSLPNLATLQKSALVDDFEHAWFQFLGTLNSVPEILKTGCREDPKSRQWWAAKERFIRTDAMLRYLHHARGVDYHGDVRLLKLMTSAGVPGETDYGFERPSGGPHLDLHIPDHIKGFTLWYEPLPVQDKNGNTFNPPHTFRERPLLDRSPVGMARVALTFYKSLIVEAEPFST